MRSSCASSATAAGDRGTTPTSSSSSSPACLLPACHATGGCTCCCACEGRRGLDEAHAEYGSAASCGAPILAPFPALIPSVQASSASSPEPWPPLPPTAPRAEKSLSSDVAVDAVCVCVRERGGGRGVYVCVCVRERERDGESARASCLVGRVHTAQQRRHRRAQRHMYTQTLAAARLRQRAVEAARGKGG